MFKTNVAAIKEEIRQTTITVRSIKERFRRKVDPNKTRESRRLVLTHGRNITADEGGNLNRLAKRATLLCTIRALMRGKAHAKTFLNQPAHLQEIIDVWKTFELKVVISNHEVTEEAVQSTNVVE